MSSAGKGSLSKDIVKSLRKGDLSVADRLLRAEFLLYAVQESAEVCLCKLTCAGDVIWS